VRRVENEVWVMERNPNYWNKGLPYLDGIEFYHGLPFSPELGSALLSGRTDYARLLDPGALRKVKATNGMSGTDFYQSVIQGTWMNNKKKPFDDPRVRRAFNLALDKHVLVDVVKDVAPMMVGGFLYPFSEFATPKEELFKRPGYQTDTTAAVKEAKELMAAAGYAKGVPAPLDYLVRDLATFKLWAQAVQAMLQEALGVQSNLRPVVESVWFDDVKTGNYDLAVGAIVSTLLDPSDYFNAWYRKDGPQNYSNWDNAEFNALLPNIDGEVDAAKRMTYIRKAEEIMEKDPPVLPISWEKINDGWYNYVKGHNPSEYFGIYDVVRMDTMWLDK
jgi:ABC-type oligopeptide transport system substrate-binding subunit